jgi:MFS family permease
MFLGGSLVAASGVALMGITTNIWGIYLGYGLAQAGVSAVSSIGLPILLASWFDDSMRGKVSGIAFAGSGIGNIFLQSLSIALIQKFGYNKAYIMFAIAAAVVGSIIALLIIRAPKNEDEIVKGKVVESEVKEETKEEVKELTGYTFAEVKKIKSYWLYALGFVFVGMYIAVLTTQYAAYLRSYGIETGTVGSVFAIFSIFGNLGGGYLYDKLGVAKTSIVGFVLSTTAVLSLMFAPQIPALAYLYGASMGLSVFSYILAPSMLAGALFGKKDFATIFAITNIFFALGFAFGSLIFGVLVGKVGYGISWIFVLAFVIIAYLLLLYGIAAFTKLAKKDKKEEVNA